MRHFILPIFLLLALALPAGAKEVKIHGYVTNITSPTTFEIEDYRITRDLSLVLELDKGDSDEGVQFHPEDIRVGTELEIKGDYNEKTEELRAKSIKVFLDDYKKVKRTALIERQPDLKRTPEGWEGTFFADGERIRVDSSTRVLFKPNKSEAKELRNRRKEKTQTSSARQAMPSTESESDDGLRLLESLDQIGPNTFMTYEGRRQADGSIWASRIAFVRGEIEKGEANLWRQLEPNVKGASLQAGKPGELRIRKVGKFKLVPNADVQNYVRRIGESLVPAFQRNMAPNDPNKIPFQFYVVEAKQPNAFALANGVVVLHSSMFDVLEDEAQLAAVLGHEITHTMEKHTWHELQYHKKKLTALKIGGAVAAGMGAYGVQDITNLVEGAVRNGYSRSLENQADREGIQNMLEAGYDPREAPNLWKAMTRRFGDQPTNLFWSNHDSNTTRRSYLMAELRDNYAGVDFSGLKKDSDEFGKMAAAARAGVAAKKKVKVKY